MSNELTMSANLTYFYRGYLHKKWKEAYFVLCNNGILKWYKDSYKLDLKGEINVRDVAHLVSVGEFTRCIPKRPPIEFDENLLIAIPKDTKKNPKKVLWILCKDLAELNSWMKFMVKTFTGLPSKPALQALSFSRSKPLTSAHGSNSHHKKRIQRPDFWDSWEYLHDDDEEDLYCYGYGLGWQDNMNENQCEDNNGEYQKNPDSSDSDNGSDSDSESVQGSLQNPSSFSGLDRASGAEPNPTPSDSAPDPTPSDSAPDPTPSDSAPDSTPSYSEPDSTPSYSAPDPTPSYSAPDPTPSYSAPDPTPSYSFSSGCDSGGGGGGCDSGGGGGGGDCGGGDD